jgi:hypothetical protein
VSESLVRTIVLYSLLLGGWAGLSALTGRGPSPIQVAGLAILELALVGQALGDALGLLGGHSPADGATHAGYLLASVSILPLAGAGAVDREPERWDGFIVAIACVVTAVVVLRLFATWPSGDAA